MAGGTVSIKEAVGPYLWDNKSVTRENNKRFLVYNASLNLREYLENTIFKRIALLHTSPFLSIIISAKTTPALGCRPGLILWSLCSQNLRPCGFFPWLYLEIIRYSRLCNTLSEVGTKMIQAVVRIDEDTLKNVYKTWNVFPTLY